MQIVVIGLGYLGLTHAVAMASLGHQVLGIEASRDRLTQLKAGKLPFYEPGLAEAMAEVVSKDLLSFEASVETAIDCEMLFLCVGTPQTGGSNAADTSFVFAAGEALAKVINEDTIVVGKSTVPVGTAASLQKKMSDIAGFDVKLAWNPEFLREGTALEDSLKPDRIVIGAWHKESVEALRSCYEKIIATGTPVIETDVATAELVKVAANAFLATKVSFINAMAEVAEASGADAVSLAEAIGYDDRIGKKFLRTGVGFGGGCLPKDIRGFMARAKELGVGSAVSFLEDVDAINLRRRQRVVDLAEQELGELAGKKILVLGLSFKPDSDDMRDSPALDIALRLAAGGAEVTVHDPVALEALGDTHTELVREKDLNAAFEAKDLVVLATEWREYRELDPAVARSKVANKTIIDGRNVLDVAAWQAAGWKVIALGRNVHN